MPGGRSSICLSWSTKHAWVYWTEVLMWANWITHWHLEALEAIAIRSHCHHSCRWKTSPDPKAHFWLNCNEKTSLDLTLFGAWDRMLILYHKIPLTGDTMQNKIYSVIFLKEEKIEKQRLRNSVWVRYPKFSKGKRLNWEEKALVKKKKKRSHRDWSTHQLVAFGEHESLRSPVLLFHLPSIV